MTTVRYPATPAPAARLAHSCSADAIGSGLSVATVIDKRPVTFNLRYYREYEFQDRVRGNAIMAWATMRF
jgi:hypothetical protein